MPEAGFAAGLASALVRMESAADLSAVTAAVAEAAAQVLGPVGVMAGLRDASGQALLVAGLHAVPPSVMCGNKTLPLSARLPMTDAAVMGRAVWMSGAPERARKYPELAARTPEPYACGSLPLTEAGLPLGVMCLIRMAGPDGVAKAFTADERAFAGILAGMAGPAIGRLSRAREDCPSGPGRREEAGVFEWDPGRDWLWCTANTLRLHGQPCDAGPADRVRQASCGQLPGFLAALHALAAGGDGRVISYRGAAADGSPLRLEARGSLVIDALSGQRRVVGVVTEAVSGSASSAWHPYSGLVPGELSAIVAAAVTMGDFSRAAAASLRVLPADGLLIAEQDADRIHVVTVAGLPNVAARPRGYRSEARIPAGARLADRTPVYVKSTPELVARFPHWQPVIAGLGNRAWAVLPLASGYGAPAACLLACRPGWSPSGSEQTRLLMAAGLLGPALDRCRAHDHQHRLITAMRPDPPGNLPGLSIACRYQPATFGLGVGGDFCDAFTDSAGIPVLIIGDVQGHGPGAADIAAKLRTAIRAYALDGHSPAQTLARTSRFLADLNGEDSRPLYATCCYLTLDPPSGRVRASRAGHPQPILITASGPARRLAVSGGPPLGVSPGGRYPASTCTITAGSTVLLYTDGLTERPGKDTEAQTSELLRQLGANRAASPDAMLATLTRLNDNGPRYDDIAVLAARYDPRCLSAT